MSHNVHGLIHIADDYERFGPLDNISAFPFENFMKNLKKKLSNHEMPLQQSKVFMKNLVLVKVIK